jgi:membrane protein
MTVMHKLGSTIWAAIGGYQKHNVNRLSASIAFYGILSLAPLAVIAVTVAGFFFGKNAAEGLIVDQLKNTLGADAAKLVQGVLANAYQSRATLPATTLAVLVLLWSSTRLVGDIRGALNTIWEVQGRGGTGFKGFLVGKLIDFGMVLVFAALFLLTVAANLALTTVTHYFAHAVPLPAEALYVSGLAFFAVVAFIFLSVIFRWLPNRTLPLRDVALGAGLSAVLLEIGNSVLGFYLARSSPGSAFGAAGSFVVIMVWMYYTAIIILFGVEVSRAYRHFRLGGWPPPRERVTKGRGRKRPAPEKQVSGLLKVRRVPGPPPDGSTSGGQSADATDARPQDCVPAGSPSGAADAGRHAGTHTCREAVHGRQGGEGGGQTSRSGLHAVAGLSAVVAAAAAVAAWLGRRARMRAK